MSGGGQHRAGLGEQILVAAHAVVLHDLGSGRVDADDLGFHPEREHKGMARSVVGLEAVFLDHAVVRHVAIVAGGDPGMAAGGPGGVLGGHDMAIHAGRRVVAQVGRRPGNPKREGR